MDLTMNSAGKLIVLAAILVVFAIAGWRIGAPQSFQTALAEAGLGAPPTPALTAPASPQPAPAEQPAPAQPSGDSGAGH